MESATEGMLPHPSSQAEIIRFKVCIITVGSRGDVQPFVFLAQELLDRGHEVVFCTHESLRSMVTSLFRSLSPGCQFVGLGGDPAALLQEPRVQKLLKNNDMVSLQMALQGLLENCYLGNAQIIGDAVTSSSRRVDVVVSGLPAWSLALVLAEAWDVPIVQFCFMPPALPAPDLAPPLISTKPLPFAWMNYAAGTLV
jgi:hypothetical protein